jgi:predicted AAA+ superfamily ATPase
VSSVVAVSAFEFLGREPLTAERGGSGRAGLATLQYESSGFILQCMRRACEPLLAEYLAGFPCVAVIGPRQCGKTTLAGLLPAGWRRFDLEKASDRDLVARDPDLFLRLHPRQVVIDEAQLLPDLFPALRVAIDAERSSAGRFVITGSSSPALLRHVSETLAGRIATIELAPFSWSEVHPSPERPAFVDLLADRSTTAARFLALRARGDIRQVHDYWLRGGYPEPWLKPAARFGATWMSHYVKTYVERDIGRLFPGLDQDRFRLFLQHLAGLSGTIINNSDVARGLGVSPPTARDYFEIAHGTFLWRRLPPYVKQATKRLVKHSKGHLRDSGLLHRLLHLTTLDALLGHPQAGRSWEAMVSEEVLRQLEWQGLDCGAFFYRTAAGAEIDLVLEGDIGLVPIEIKSTHMIDRRRLAALREFVAERRCRYGLVITNDSEPRLLDEAIVAVPFSHL